MAQRLHQQSLARVDQDDRGIGGRGSRRHVSGVLLVPRRIRHDEAPPVGREVAVRNINGDVLLALGLQAVKQPRVVDLVAAALLGSRAQPRQTRRPESSRRRTEAGRSACSCRRRRCRMSQIGGDRPWARKLRASEVPLPLLALHRPFLVTVDRAPTALQRSPLLQFLNDISHRLGIGFDRSGQGITAERFETGRAGVTVFPLSSSAAGRHPP